MRNELRNYGLIITMILFTAISFPAAAQDKVNMEWAAPQEANQITNPLQGNIDATKAGKKLFNQQCAVCHGNSGKGDGVAGLALNPKPASFVSEKVQSETDGAIFWKITNGRPPMAAYKELLTEEQRWQLVNYIRTFSK